MLRKQKEVEDLSYKKSVFRSLAMVTQLGLSVMTPIFLCILAGYYIDSRFGTRSILIFLLLGVLAGGQCGYRMAKQTLRVSEKEDEKERMERKKQQEGMKREEVRKPKPVSRIRLQDKEEQHE